MGPLSSPHVLRLEHVSFLALRRHAGVECFEGMPFELLVRVPRGSSFAPCCAFMNLVRFGVVGIRVPVSWPLQAARVKVSKEPRAVSL